VEGTSERPLLERFLALSADSPHRGIRYYIEDQRSALYAQLGDAESSRACLQQSRREFDELHERLPQDYRERLDDHPFAHAVRRVRAVP
jgi:hypothetical protein